MVDFDLLLRGYVLARYHVAVTTQKDIWFHGSLNQIMYLLYIHSGQALYKGRLLDGRGSVQKQGLCPLVG